ncbi:MAG: hypothetical protein AB9891_03245 [Anaerolineaceae bacterium]
MGIVVLIKLFQKEGVQKGILGIICMLCTYLWGWIHVEDQKKIMYIWTGLIILGAFLTGIMSASGNAG